jgi:citrate/tricarballylate utilization protein
MPATETLAEAERVMIICNACRYCKGHCAVFPAMERRLAFATADLNYLANLCHNCGARYHHCQYAPPHEFAVNVPRCSRTCGRRPTVTIAGRRSWHLYSSATAAP